MNYSLFFPEKPLKFYFFYGWKNVKILLCPMNEEVVQLADRKVIDSEIRRGRDKRLINFFSGFCHLFSISSLLDEFDNDCFFQQFHSFCSLSLYNKQTMV